MPTKASKMGMLAAGLDVTSDSIDVSSKTGSLVIPKGTTAQRPSSTIAGMTRYNSETGKIEYWNGSAWISIGTDLSSFTQLNTTSLAHSVVNQPGTIGFLDQGSSLISTYGAAAPSIVYNSIPYNQNFSSHGGHSGVGSYPMYWAFYSPTEKPVNQLKIRIHGNSWGYFEVYGSNDSGNSSGFATNGNWYKLILSSTTYPFGNENMGGYSCGYADGTEFIYNYSNNIPYKAYRVKILDASRGNQAFGSYYGGAANYMWQFNRV